MQESHILESDLAMSLLAADDKRSLAYRVFHCVAHFRTFRIFGNFANLKDFRSRTFWEGALGSRRLYGMNCRTHRGLHAKSKTILIGHRLMKLLRLSGVFSLISLI